MFVKRDSSDGSIDVLGKQGQDAPSDNESLWGFEDIEYLAFCLGPEILETALAERVTKDSWASLYAGVPEEPVKRLLRRP